MLAVHAFHPAIAGNLWHVSVFTEKCASQHYEPSIDLVARRYAASTVNLSGRKRLGLS
jgi:hypothetical protein